MSDKVFTTADFRRETRKAAERERDAARLSHDRGADADEAYRAFVDRFRSTTSAPFREAFDAGWEAALSVPAPTLPALDAETLPVVTYPKGYDHRRGCSRRHPVTFPCDTGTLTEAARRYLTAAPTEEERQHDD